MKTTERNSKKYSRNTLKKIVIYFWNYRKHNLFPKREQTEDLRQSMFELHLHSTTFSTNLSIISTIAGDCDLLITFYRHKPHDESGISCATSLLTRPVKSWPKFGLIGPKWGKNLGLLEISFLFILARRAKMNRKLILKSHRFIRI